MDNFLVSNVLKAKQFFYDELKGTVLKQNVAKTAYAASYVAIKLLESNNTNVLDIESFIDGVSDTLQIRDYLKSYLKGQESVVLKAVNTFSLEILKALVINEDFSEQDKTLEVTPQSIIDLALKLLKLEENESIADYCCGRGAFSRTAILECPNASYVGYEINSDNVAIAKIRAELSGVKEDIKQYDVLTIKDKSYDKIFANYPFGLKSVSTNDSDNTSLQFLSNNIGVLPKKASSDWLFLTSIINSLKIGGKAVALLTPNSAYNTIDTEIRRFFVSNGFIESVIALPENLLDYTAIPTLMIVLSFNNTNISFIDATNECVRGRRKNTLTNENISNILDAVSNKTKICCSVKVEDLNNTYELHPQRYVVYNESIANGIEFGEVITNVSRGAQMKAADLDSMVSDTVEDTRYLTLNDIQDGIVGNSLPYLKELNPKLNKYCVKDRAFLISKNGPVFKTAFITLSDNERVLVNGNMYILDLDYSRINPYYLQALLESEFGQEIIRKAAVGTALITLTVEGLKNMIIPVPSLEEQDIIGEKYRELSEQVAELKSKLSEINKERKSTFTISK